MKHNRLTHEWRLRINKQCRNFKAKYFYKYAINEEKSIIYSSEEKRLLHFTKATVEHIVPLCELVDRFLQSRGLDRTAKPTGSVLKEWREFHRKNAKLKLVSSGYNQLTAVEIWKERETYRKKITREWGNNSCHNLQ